MIEVVEKFAGGAKDLPRHPETGGILNVFQANGNKYYILTPQDAFPVSRFGWFSKFAMQFMANADFTNAYQRRVKMRELLNDFAARRSEYTDLVLANEAEAEEVRKMSEMRYTPALYMATLFIYREGEDAAMWTMAQAEEKIEDWAAEGLGINDFFTLSGVFVAAYSDLLTELWAQVASK
jgi:hypothetical protein